MNGKDKVSLPGFFTILYFADVFTSLIAVMFWGDFPHTSIYMVALVNSVLLWIMFKILVYLIVIFVFKKLIQYSQYAENILIAVTVIYGILLLNNLASVTMQAPVFNICPEFYRSIELNRIDVIP